MDSLPESSEKKIARLEEQNKWLVNENIFLRGLCEELQGKRNCVEVEAAFRSNFIQPPGKNAKPVLITDVLAQRAGAFEDLGKALDELEQLKLISPSTTDQQLLPPAKSQHKNFEKGGK